MDYSDYNSFMAEIVSQSTTLNPSPDKANVDKLITAASRAIDHYCTGVVDPDATDYFKAETKTDEPIFGRIDRNGVILCYPHKPIITTVTSFAWKAKISDAWTSVDPSLISASGPRLEAYPVSPTALNQRIWVKISYTGGLGATTSALPADFQELVTLLAIRFYREGETGVTDAIGVAELSTLVYTKAWPVRVREGLQVYKRTAGWRWIA